jgi:hypothetical protein
MKNILLPIIILSLELLNLLNAEFDSDYFTKYNGYSVYKVIVKNEKDLSTLKMIETKLKNKLDYWTETKKLNYVHIMLKPELKPYFENALKFSKLEYDIYIKDVSILIKNQIDLNKAVSSSDGDFDYGKYHTLDEINDWMNDLENQYPKLVTVFNVSRSYQKRNIYAMKISVPNASRKPAIWLDGGIHAREWYELLIFYLN